MNISIKGWQRLSHNNAIAHGFYGLFDPANLDHVALRLILIHSEVTEAFEELRSGHRLTRVGDWGKPEGLPTELADIVIRTLDLAEALGINLEKEMERKHAYNLTRPYKHGKEC